ncbi:MAG TPA: hypothetical protein VGU20_26040 [Stellaceae bacterium]|nr:hypothetical protein [Stellaceae bacterium]
MPTNFLWDAGTSNNGLLTSAFSLLTTELNSIASTDSALSSVGGSSGVFTNGNTAQAIFAELQFEFGAAVGSALSAGANLAGWFVQSQDGGSTFEATASNAPLPRAPDFIIPLPATTIAIAAIYKAQGLVRVPALQFKVFLLNNSGQPLPSSGNILQIAPVAVQY